MHKTTALGELFPNDALLDWFRTHVDSRANHLHARKFQGGQSNPTYLVSGSGRDYVLRSKPSGALLGSAHAVDREFRVTRALAQTSVPVPRPYAYCDDDAILGSPFYVMDHVPGRIFWNPALPDETPAARARIFDAMNCAIAALHALEPARIGLLDFGKSGRYLERQVQRWTRQYRAAETETIDAMERLIDWLPANLPLDEETGLVHGDFRIDNLIFDPDEERIAAILDWELSTLGHPLVDFAYHCMTWRLAGTRGLGDHSPMQLHQAGIPSEAEYVRDYCARTGRAAIEPHAWNYYIVFNKFRLASILQGVRLRGLQGNASSPDALVIGGRTRPIAESAWREVESSCATLENASRHPDV